MKAGFVAVAGAILNTFATLWFKRLGISLLHLMCFVLCFEEVAGIKGSSYLTLKLLHYLSISIIKSFDTEGHINHTCRPDRHSWRLKLSKKRYKQSWSQWPPVFWWWSRMGWRIIRLIFHHWRCLSIVVHECPWCFFAVIQWKNVWIECVCFLMEWCSW